MRRLMTIYLIGLISFGVPAFALDAMGPPAAGLRQNQFELGADYSYSTMDLRLVGGKWVEWLNGSFYDAGRAFSLTLENVKTNKMYIGFGYGITDNWDVSLRLGGANARFGDSIWGEGEKFDNPTDFAFGLSTRATFYQEDNLKLGGLLQFSWTELDGKLKSAYWPVSDSVDIELREIQIAIGPTYQPTDTLSIYGGPFFHRVSGELKDRFSEMYQEGLLTSRYSWDIKERSVFGGYIGLQIDASRNASFNIEYQYTGAADALGLGFIWRF